LRADGAAGIGLKRALDQRSYAEAHPEAVSEMVLFSVVTTTRREVAWVTRDAGRFFPAAGASSGLVAIR
jgi:hypothetical protein